MFFEEMLRREFGRGIFEEEYEEPCDCSNCRFRNQQRSGSGFFSNNFRYQEEEEEEYEYDNFIDLELTSKKVTPFEIQLRWRNPRNKEFTLTMISQEEGYEKIIYKGKGNYAEAENLKSSTFYQCLS
jgi:hypothetical protein